MNFTPRIAEFRTASLFFDGADSELSPIFFAMLWLNVVVILSFSETTQANCFYKSWIFIENWNENTVSYYGEKVKFSAEQIWNNLKGNFISVILAGIYFS